ncbi:MAG: hypothetical protein IJF76_04490 [Clostridia bacterium]|nr:hypothetical protein [Clostridia bacterium]
MTTIKVQDVLAILPIEDKEGERCIVLYAKSGKVEKIYSDLTAKTLERKLKTKQYLTI